MSGIAGIFFRDGRPVDRLLLERMTALLAHRGPDGINHWTDGPVGLGHCMLHTTPESLRERQPLAEESGSLCLAWDGRIDNREELRSALETRGATLRTDTDAELVLRAYESWDLDCPKRILGDFAFAIWDRRRQQLFCARDPLGIKAFYYYADEWIFLFGSELRPILEDPHVPRKPNEGMIGEYLANAIVHREETLYRNVYRLPAAHVLVVQPGRLRKERYWDVDAGRDIHYRTDAEYAEHFREVFQQAVRCRLRSQGPVGAQLSGGLDSSSIVAVANSLYRRAELADPGFETFSLVFPGLPCDESAYIRDMVQMADRKGNYIRPDPMPFSFYAEEARRYHDFPNVPNGDMFYPLFAWARERGFRGLLTGLGGDQWFDGNVHQYADLLRGFKIADFIRKVRFASILYGAPWAVLSILSCGLLPLLPHTPQRVLRKVTRRLLQRRDIPRWINSQFARRAQLAERSQPVGFTRPFGSVAQAKLSASLDSGWDAFYLELADRYGAAFGLEQRHPFYDRRVVEFALALPEEQRWRRDQQKFVLRQAVRDLLPETISRRCLKVHFSNLFAQTLYELGGERLFTSLDIASNGWVNEERVRQMCRETMEDYAAGNEQYADNAGRLWMIFGIERWFQAVFNPSQRRNHGAKTATAVTT